jgi:hypothetical protein
MPSERFEMISAGSLDNSGDLFEKVSHHKLFSIESFFSCGTEKPEESTLDHISCNSNLVIK